MNQVQYEYIRDNRGKLLATQHLFPNGDEILYDAGNHMLGKYIDHSDITLNERGAMIGRGNQLMRLIKD